MKYPIIDNMENFQSFISIISAQKVYVRLANLEDALHTLWCECKRGKSHIRPLCATCRPKIVKQVTTGLCRQPLKLIGVCEQRPQKYLHFENKKDEVQQRVAFYPKPELDPENDLLSFSPLIYGPACETAIVLY